MRVTRAPRRLVREIEVDGVVQTRADPDAWWDAFVAWLESRGERFNGRIAPYREEATHDRGNAD